ncbi:polyphosphate:AMP phosphotransferase [Methanolobus sp. ZRKC2]|uniref:polyphosphate:AMP phosphotransferase n=1 Tax=Methanolobus sp. ZRKC2 TaxID=3125783 RepID=UPI0032496B59
MLEKVDLSKSIGEKEYRKLTEEYSIRLGELQRKAWKMDIPIIVVFEGWHASGMAEIINRFLMPLNPMGFELYTAGKPCAQEEKKPLIWRFWTKIPKKGEIAIFDRSWYRRALLEHFSKNISEKDTNNCLNGLTYFEKQLADDNYLIIKFFLHISKERQQKRFEDIRNKGTPLFLVKEEEEDYIIEYDKFLPLIEKMLEKSDISHSPWNIIESDDLNFATVKVMASFIRAVEERIDREEENHEKAKTKATQTCTIPALNTSILEKIDLSKSLPKDEYEKEIKKYQKKLSKLQYQLFMQDRPLIIAFEGWDASGKGGGIRRLAQALNPRIYRVVPVGVPSDVELAHNYMWRFYNEIPEAGHIAIFDRSWYGRVLVERVENLCGDQEWKRAYREINEFEEILSNYGTIIIKFWVHIDKDEQLHRFRKREKTAHKKWKITDDDWKNRDKWDLYADAVNEMLQKTSTTYAPWTIVEGNDKKFARIKILRTVVETLEKELKVK